MFLLWSVEPALIKVGLKDDKTASDTDTLHVYKLHTDGEEDAL